MAQPNNTSTQGDPAQICPGCQELKCDVERRRQNTQFPNDDLNWVICCEACYEDTLDYWNEMHQEANAGRL